MTRRTNLSAALPALVLAVLAMGGCGSSDDPAAGSTPPDYATALAGSPAPLAALHEQENELISGGTDAYEKRIAALRGYPIVANVWASWCGPCREEFPVLQDLAARYGKRVAFVGINSEDGDDTASSFLAEAPVPYPSYTDPDSDIKDSIGATRGVPDTAFYGKDGELCYLKIGPYPDESELEADVRTYALGGACPESG
jgi:cytochrome c biogenesis protein CcmG/thiol:disulfide interchange protein DsbE